MFSKRTYVFFLVCVERPFCFTKVLLVAITTQYAVYHSMKEVIVFHATTDCIL